MDSEVGPRLIIEETDEKDVVRHIGSQLTMLWYHCDQFESAIALMDHVRARPRLEHAEPSLENLPKVLEAEHQERLAHTWANIAAHHAAMTVYHFQSTLRSVRAQLEYAPALAKKVDTKALEMAFGRISEDFPAWRYVRDWVGHFADKMFKPADIAEHQIEGAPFLHGALFENTLVFTRLGERISLDVTEASLARLRSIKNEVYAAFRKASR